MAVGALSPVPDNIVLVASNSSNIPQMLTNTTAGCAFARHPRVDVGRFGFGKLDLLHSFEQRARRLSEATPHEPRVRDVAASDKFLSILFGFDLDDRLCDIALSKFFDNPEEFSAFMVGSEGRAVAENARDASQASASR